MIPHDFGFSVPPSIASEELLSHELELVEALGNIEICSRLIGAQSAASAMSSVDRHYASLCAALTEVPCDSSEWAMIAEYVAKGHGPTHLDYTVTPRTVLAVERQMNGFGPFAADPQRMLLWHGSSICNFVAILKEGLRVKPAGVAHVGSMFGNGLYFADVCTKAGNYCRASKSRPRGVLLLAEVALGATDSKMYASDTRKRGTHSVTGLGALTPERSTWRTMDNGCVVPIGHLRRAEDALEDMDAVSDMGRLRYNEFVVYDTNRVRIRYCVLLDFHYRLEDW